VADEAEALIDLATAISDGAPVDWPSVQSSNISDADRAVLQHLRVIAEIVSLQQRLASQPVHASVVDELRQEEPRAPDAREALPSWGPLRLIRLVGQGAFGEVYRAWDSRLDREVALKLLRRRESRRSTGSSLVDEGRLLAKVRHPNVITVYGAERIGDHVGVWMEFVDGPTLAQLVASNGPFAPDEVARIGRDLCGALAAVHRAGLLHRDIKAQNVMRDADGRVVLMDFGAGREEQTAVASPRDMAGTPLYLAPEIFDEAAASVQSDIYSLGVLLYHLTTGAYPVDASTFVAIRDGHRRGVRRLLADARPDLPRALAGVIDRALSPDPVVRFSTADEMARSLEAPTERGSRHALWLSAAALVVAGVVGAVVLTRSTRPTSQPFTTVSGEAAVTVRRFGQPDDVAFDGIPSADGRYLPYIESKAGNLILLDLTTGGKRPLTQFAGFQSSGGNINTGPSMSPDDSRVAYVWDTDHSTELYVVDADGSHARSLVRDTELHRWWGIEPFEWTRDGRFILVAIHRKDGTHTIALVSSDDGSVRTLKTSRQFAYRISLSPDGRYVAYDASPDPAVDAHDIYVLATDGSYDARIVEDPADDSHPIWTPDGRGLLFTSTRTGSTAVWHVAMAQGRPAAVPDLVNRDMGQMFPIGVTERGTMFYLRQTGMVDVYTGDLDPVSGKLRGSATAASRGFVGTNISPDWSRDGRFLTYVSQRGNGIVGPGSRVLVIRSLADGGERTISPPLHFYIAPRWAPDGRSIYVTGATSSEEYGLIQVDAANGAILASVLGDGNFSSGALSRDGRTYISSDSGRIVETELASHRKTVVPLAASAGKPLFVALSPDEQSFAFSTPTSPAGTWVAVVPRRGGEPRILVKATEPEFVQLQAWAPDGTWLLFDKGRSVNGQTGQPTELWRVDVADGRAESMGFSMVGLRDLRIHPDGGRFAFTAGWPSRELWVMENFLPAPATRTH
jgi:serine/threonine-protein kinase